MGLEMKYFVLKPRAKSVDDAFAKASQRAMSAYADSLEDDGVELELARELSLWSVDELLRQRNLAPVEKGDLRTVLGDAIAKAEKGSDGNADQGGE